MNHPLDKLKTFIKQYGLQQLTEAKLNRDPIAQFKDWLGAALESEPREPNAMTLATVDLQGRPSSRIMLLKEVNEQGFVFFTNYDSRKSGDLALNPYVALVFWWPYIERQVRIEGRVEKISAAASDSYFASRSRESQIGAHASQQSQILPDRQTLDKRFEKLAAQYKNEESIPRPSNWGGYVVIPHAIEFWQGGPHRLHDRFRYERQNDTWIYFRLSP